MKLLNTLRGDRKGESQRSALTSSNIKRNSASVCNTNERSEKGRDNISPIM
jgi:hypothetical protein